MARAISHGIFLPIPKSVNGGMETVENKAEQEFAEARGEAQLTYETILEYAATSGPKI